MAALLLVLPLLLFGCAEDPTRSSGTALDDRMFFALAEKSVTLTSSQATYTSLAWWSFEAESLPHADGRYTLRQEMLAASIDELLPPEGHYLYDSWGQYLFDGTTLNLFREGGTYLTPRASSISASAAVFPSSISVGLSALTVWSTSRRTPPI